MSRPRSTLTGLVAAVAGLTLAGCHSATSSAASPATSTSAGTAASAAPTAGAGSGGVSSGPGAVAYFPDQVGDTWVYSISSRGTEGTVTDKVTAVAPVASGTQVTMTTVDSLTSSSKPFTATYIVHPDGSISVPFQSAAEYAITVKAGGIIWPSAAQLASGQPHDETVVMTETAAGQSTTVTVNAVVKGGGTQQVSVPAGSYSTTLVDEDESEKIMGTPVTIDIKTWVANGVGRVKSEISDGSGTGGQVEQLISFTKG